MKKSILAVLLTLVLVSPVFAAEQGSIDIVGKIGCTVNSKEVLVSDKYDYVEGYKKNPALSIAVEGFYYVLPELPLGLGINYQFDSKHAKPSGEWGKFESGVTNIYLTVKPTAKIDSNIFTALYAIGQIGYGLNRISLSSNPYNVEVGDNGLYWGLGAGTEIMNDFIFEFIFSTNYWKAKNISGHYDMENTALTFFAGYKFNI